MPKRKILAVLCSLYCVMAATASHAQESTERRDSIMDHYDPAQESTAKPAVPVTGTAAATEAPAKPAEESIPEGTVRVPYIPEPVKEQLKKEIETEMREKITEDIVRRARKERWGISDAWPEWVRSMTWTGDIRLRAQHDDYDPSNELPGSISYLNYQRINDSGSDSAEGTILNITEDRTRLRTRLRLGARANVTENWDIGFRLATGSSSDPVSTNTTLGNYNQRFAFNLDRVFLRYQNRSQAFSFWGGRMPNPFFGTDLVWDEDVAFDGLAFKLRPLLRIEDGGYRTFDPYLTFGAFPLQEVELSSQDKWLYGAQLGANWRSSNTRLSLGVAYYDYSNIVGVRNPDGTSLNDFTAPQYVQKGNTLFSITDSSNNTNCATNCLYGLASDYNELNATMTFAMLYFAPTQIILTADYVKNLAWDKEKVAAKIAEGGQPSFTPLTDDDYGWQLKLTVGRPVVTRTGEWQLSGGYKYLGRDAVLDAFTDSDFHLGGTDAKGWFAGGSYAVADNVWFQLRVLSTSEISNPPFGIDTWQLDLNARF